MKKYICPFLLALLLLSGCGRKETTHVELSPPPEVEAEIIVEQTEETPPAEIPEEPVIIVPEEPSIVIV